MNRDKSELVSLTLALLTIASEGDAGAQPPRKTPVPPEPRALRPEGTVSVQDAKEPRRRRQPLCWDCNHPRTLHGTAQAHCQACGCRCGQYLPPDGAGAVGADHSALVDFLLAAAVLLGDVRRGGAK